MEDAHLLQHFPSLCTILLDGPQQQPALRLAGCQDGGWQLPRPLVVERADQLGLRAGAVLDRKSVV